MIYLVTNLRHPLPRIIIINQLAFFYCPRFRLVTAPTGGHTMKCRAGINQNLYAATGRGRDSGFRTGAGPPATWHCRNRRRSSPISARGPAGYGPNRRPRAPVPQAAILPGAAHHAGGRGTGAGDPCQGGVRVLPSMKAAVARDQQAQAIRHLG